MKLEKYGEIVLEGWSPSTLGDGGISMPGTEGTIILYRKADGAWTCSNVGLPDDNFADSRPAWFSKRNLVVEYESDLGGRIDLSLLPNGIWKGKGQAVKYVNNNWEEKHVGSTFTSFDEAEQWAVNCLLFWVTRNIDDVGKFGVNRTSEYCQKTEITEDIPGKEGRGRQVKQIYQDRAAKSRTNKE